MGETDDLTLAKEGEGQEEGRERRQTGLCPHILYIFTWKAYLNDSLSLNRPRLLAVYWAIN